MKLELRVNVEPYVSLQFQSEYSQDMKAAARDLIMQMEPYAKQYPAIAKRITELQKAYNV